MAMTIGSGRLLKLLDTLSSSLWFRPLVLVLFGIVGGVLFPMLDRRGLFSELAESEIVWWLVQGTPGGSRDLISASAGALATILAVAFSMTMVTIQLASSNYSPRLLRRFMSDKTTQRVLGTYLGSIVYLLLVLRTIRGESDQAPEFVPLVSVTLGILVTIGCLALLPSLLHHVARSVQAATIIHRIGEETQESLQSRPVESLERADEENGPEEEATCVRTRSHGYLQVIDEKELVRALPRGVERVRIEAQVGDFLMPGTRLLSFWPEAELDEGQEEEICAAFVSGRERTETQDVLFGVRQLVDVALKALSPGINDVTTAVMVVNELAALTRAVVETGRLGEGYCQRTIDGVLLVTDDFGLVPFLRSAWAEIPFVARDHPRVLARMLEALAEVAATVREPELRAALLEPAAWAMEALEHGSGLSHERGLVQSSWRDLQSAVAGAEQPPHAHDSIH